MRRPLLIAALLTLTVIIASACGAPARDEGSGPAGKGFPIEIEHKYGTTEIPRKPKKVVTLGLTDQDAVLALGVKPIAVTDWYGDRPKASWPWAVDRFGDSDPVILAKGEFDGTQEFDYDELLDLDPDLILSLYGGISKKQYETLSRIAPTVAQPERYVDYGIPWQEQTRITGEALGEPARAERLVARVESRFAAVRRKHPEWKGRSGIVAERGFGEGESFARGPQDPRTRFLTQMGFELPDEVAKLAGDKDGAAISDERISLLDSDLLLWNLGFAPKKVQAELDDFDLYDRLSVARDERAVFVTDPTASAALTWSTVLSIPYALDEAVPMIERSQRRLD